MVHPPRPQIPLQLQLMVHPCTPPPRTQALFTHPHRSGMAHRRLAQAQLPHTDTEVAAVLHLPHTDTEVAAVQLPHTDTEVAAAQHPHTDTEVAAVQLTHTDTEVAAVQLPHTDTEAEAGHLHPKVPPRPSQIWRRLCLRTLPL